MKFLMITVAALFALSAYADVTLIEKTDETTSVSHFSKGRIAVYENNQVVNITDLKNKMLYGFNAAGKIFFKAGFKDMMAMSSGGSELSADQKIPQEKNAVVIKKTAKANMPDIHVIDMN